MESIKLNIVDDDTNINTRTMVVAMTTSQQKKDECITSPI